MRMRADRNQSDYVTLYAQYGDRSICKICSRVYKSLGMHIRVHNLTEEEYKDKFELMRTLPLCVPELSIVFAVDANHLREENILPDKEFSSRLGKARKGHSPVVTTATRKFRVKFGKSRKGILTLEQLEEKSKRTKEFYLIHPEVKRSISNSLVEYYSTRRNLVDLVCEQCGKKYQRVKSKQNKKHNFCNKKCSGIYHSALLKTRNEKIISMFNDGVSIPIISKELGMTRANVWLIIDKLKKSNLRARGHDEDDRQSS